MLDNLHCPDQLPFDNQDSATPFAPVLTINPKGLREMKTPTECDYAPPGEYIKDHTLLFHDGWWHLFSISGIQGYYHGYNGNEETISWSISRNLVDWEMRGHVLHASQWEGAFDQHEVWAPFCLRADGRFHLFYTGIIHPTRPREDRRLGHSHPWVHQGHRETQGLAVSSDLTDWVKRCDFHQGLGIPGRDSHVVRDEENGRWLLYSTGPKREGLSEGYVSESRDLVNWDFRGTFLKMPDPDPKRIYGETTHGLFGGDFSWGGMTESMTVMKHPLSGRWIVLANWQYALSDDPTDFLGSEVREYDLRCDGRAVDIGFAGETIAWQGKWYRSGVIGERDYWRLGLTEIEWVPEGAFRVVTPSVLSTLPRKP